MNGSVRTRMRARAVLCRAMATCPGWTSYDLPMESTSARALDLARILHDAPAIHGELGAGDLITHGLTPAALTYIERTVRVGDRTLETGSGYSTILLAALGAEHICIVPNQPEVDRIQAYLLSQGVSLDRLTFHVAPSERVLPGLALAPLDLVLVDGSHSFPQVFIDWFYSASALRVGGSLIVDDVHVWTGRVLRKFLVEEPEWDFADELGGRTAIFHKVADVDPDKLWTLQPYVVKRSRPGLPAQARMAASMLRHGQQDDLKRMVRSKFGR